MKNGTRILSILLAALFFTAILPPDADAATKISLSYGSYDNSASIVYSDDFFSSPSTAYDHDLAKASLGMALSAGTAKGTYDDQYASERDKNIKSVLNKLGFSSYASYGYEKPFDEHSDTAAFAVAQKKLSDGTTLLALAIRGTGYGGEWNSNFRFGDENKKVYDYHYGFVESAKAVENDLADYMSKNKLSAKSVKLWISGYSRGASVADILGARLLSSGSYKEGSLYVYTFGACALVNKSLVTKEYSGIYNVLIQSDVVANLVFPEYGFARYGTSIYLPSRLLCADYASMLPSVAKRFSELTGETYEPFSKQELLVYLVRKAAFGFLSSPSVYVSKYQDMITEEFNKLMNGSSGSFSPMVGLVFSMLKSKMKASDPIGTDPILSAQVDKSVDDLVKRLDSSTLLHDHWAECYIAWMEKYEPSGEASAYTVLSTTGNVDVEVKDASGKVVASIVGGSEKTAETSILVTVDSSKNKSVYLPSDGKYTITYRGAAGSGLDMTISYFNGEMTRCGIEKLSGKLGTLGELSYVCEAGRISQAAKKPSADIDGNGLVNSADLTLLLKCYGEKGGSADIDGNGLVNSADLTLLLNSYGSKV